MATTYKDREAKMLSELHPKMRPLCEAFLAQCRVDAKIPKGVEVRLTCTYRTHAKQAELYAQGRTAPGPKVTNAKPGQSKHNWTLPDGRPGSVAFDMAPFRLGPDGKTMQPIWGTTGADGKIWLRLGEIGESLGLEWAGRWVSFKEYPHFQLKAGTY